jgi:hypothetical protein
MELRTEQIANLEEEYGAIPADYRAFLEKGEYEDWYSFENIPTEALYDDETTLYACLDLDAILEYYEPIPEEFIPVATLHGSCYGDEEPFILALNKQDLKVWMIAGEDSGTDYASTGLSFNDWFNSLEEADC